MKANVYVEFYGKQLVEADLVAAAKKIWTNKGNKCADLKKLNLYIKPEDNTVYCVFNDDETDSFSLGADE